MIMPPTIYKRVFEFLILLFLSKVRLILKGQYNICYKSIPLQKKSVCGVYFFVVSFPF